MKKIFPLFLICLSGFCCDAQTDTLISQISKPDQKTLFVKPSRYSYAGGVRLGLVRTNVENTTSKNSFLVGLYSKFYIDKWYFEPSINIACYETRANGNRNDFLTVDIPLVFGREVFRSENFKIHIYTGPIITIPTDDDGEDDEDESIASIFKKGASTAKINLKAGVGLDISELFTIHTEYTRIFHYFNSNVPANVLGVTFDINIAKFRELFKGVF